VLYPVYGAVQKLLQWRESLVKAATAVLFTWAQNCFLVTRQDFFGMLCQMPGVFFSDHFPNLYQGGNGKNNSNY
jgi:hypothetical protein